VRSIWPSAACCSSRRGPAFYEATVCFGLLADRDLDPPPEVASAGLRAALAELAAT
jgi:hypothetical protein